MKTVLLVNGLPRAGKDTFADFLVENYGFTKMSFADEMKNIICRTLNISRVDLENWKNERVELVVNDKAIIDFRSLLQNFGSEAMKPVFGDGVWVDILYKKIENSKSKKIVISDFRFLYEYQVKKDFDIKTILIKDDRELPLIGHASDVELYQNDFIFDVVIENDKTENFFERIKEMMK